MFSINHFRQKRTHVEASDIKKQVFSNF